MRVDMVSSHGQTVLLCVLLAVTVAALGGCGYEKTKASGMSPPISLPAAEKESDNRPVDNRPVIVAFGDSLTAGLRVDEEQNYPSRLQSKLDAAGCKYRVVNEGVSGETSAQGLNRLDSILQMHPAIVVVEFGANDGLRGVQIEQTRKNLDEIIDQLQRTGVKVVLAGMMMPPNYGNAYISNFSRIFPTLAKSRGVALVPFFLEGVAGHPELNQEDGLHPTAAGYQIVTENVWKALKPLL
jgi:acyl-CoA thioesterase I